METQNLKLRIENALNTTTYNHLRENKKNESEQQQHIPELEINENGEMLTYTLGDMRITKHTGNNMYTLDSIRKLIFGVTHKSITSFLTSLRFQYILQAYDKEFKRYQFVYYIQFDDYVKVGQTFDIRKRYQPRDVGNRVKRLIFVKNVNNCEQSIIKSFGERYNVCKGREGFVIKTSKDITDSLHLFDSIVEKYEIKVKNIIEKHVQHYKSDKIFGTGYYISPFATSIILNTYSDAKYKDCKTFVEAIETMDNSFNKSDYISVFDEGGDSFFYWKFHGYTVIVNIDKNMINASRLWNTIVKSQDKDKNNYQFRKYLQLSRTKEIIKINPDAKPTRLHYKSRPLLNGRYMPIVFVHFILHHLDAKYSYEVAKMMTESLFEKAKQEAMKKQKTTNSSTITGSDVLQTKKIRTINRLLEILDNTRLKI